jgi:tRNA threonylcarbamoyladenosine biosynthesis protein TsaB
MIVLGIETSQDIGGVAIVDEEGLIASSAYESTHQRHSSWLIPEIEHILSLSSISLSDLSGIAVSGGPGSFCGLRVGMSTAYGLSCGLSIPVIGIPTLDSLSHNLSEASMQICSIIDARRERVHIALYRRRRRLSDYMTCALSDLFSLINEDTIFVGSGVIKYGDVIKRELGSTAFFAKDLHNIPRAENIALLAISYLKKGEKGAAISYEYIHPSIKEGRGR